MNETQPSTHLLYDMYMYYVWLSESPYDGDVFYNKEIAYMYANDLVSLGKKPIVTLYGPMGEVDEAEWNREYAG